MSQRLSSASSDALPPAAKAALALRVWLAFAAVRGRVYRQPLPQLVARLGRTRPTDRRAHPPARLSRAVDRALRIGTRQPTCLVNALVLYRLLREQGDEPQLVIGLPDTPQDQSAHAWVELDGVDVGPPPGRGTHTEMARFG